MKKMKYVFALSLLVSGLRSADAVPVQTGAVIVQPKNADLVAQVMAFLAQNGVTCQNQAQAFLAQNGVTCQNQAQAFLALNTASDSTDAAIQQSFADFLKCSQTVVLVHPAQVQDILTAAKDTQTVTSSVTLEEAGAILVVANDVVPHVEKPSDVVAPQDATLVDQAPVTSTDLEEAAAAGVVAFNDSDSLVQQVAAPLDGTN